MLWVQIMGLLTASVVPGIAMAGIQNDTLELTSANNSNSTLVVNIGGVGAQDTVAGATHALQALRDILFLLPASASPVGMAVVRQSAWVQEGGMTLRCMMHVQVWH